MYKDNNYTSSAKYKFPKMYELSLEEKQTPEYCKQMCEWMYSQHLSNHTAITFSEQEKYNILRLFMAGNQPEEWYKSWLSGGKAPSNYGIDNLWSVTRTDAKKGFMNLDWTVISLMPKIMSMIIPLIKNIDYNLSVDVIDPVSGAEEEDKMIKAYVKTLFGDTINTIIQQNGIPVDVENDLTGTYEELNMIRAEGGFKANHAIELAKLLKWTEDISRWDEHVYENVIIDAITIGVSAALEDFDYERRVSKWEYVNPSKTFCQHVDSRNTNKSDYKGYQDDIRISELMQIFPDVPKEKWIGLAKKYVGYKNNPYYEYSNVENDTGYDDYLVPYLRAWWIEVNTDKYVKYKSKYGKERYHDYKRDKETMLKKGESIIDNQWRTCFETKWVIGTEFLWDYGMMKNQAKPNKKRPVIPLHIYRYPYKSIVERLAPIMNQLQIAWLKYQNAMATAFPGGIAVDINMINNIVDGGKRIPFREIIKMLFEKGFLPYKLSLSGQYQGGAVSPVQQIPSDLISKLTEYLNVISGCIKFVEDLTGLSPVALGSTPTKDQQVGTTEMAYSATMNSLKHIVDGCRVIKQDLGTTSAERIRVYIQADSETRKVYESVIGENGVKMIMAAKKREVQYGIKCVARPTDVERQMIFDTIEKSYARYINGQPGINEGQRLRIANLIQGGMDINYAGRILDAWIRRDEKKKDRQHEQNSEVQGRVIQQQKQQEAANEAELLKRKTESDILINSEKAKAEGDQDVRVEREKRKTATLNSNKEFEQLLMEENGTNERAKT